MAVLTTADFTSRDLQKAVLDNEAYLEVGETYYLSLLNEFGIGEDEQPTTVHDIVKQTVLARVNMRICSDLKGYTYNQVADGVSEDPYKVRYDDYKTDWLMWKSRVTYDILLCRKIQRGTASGRIFRA